MFYRSITVDLSRQKNRYWSKNNLTNRICWAIKNANDVNVDSAQSMFVLMILESLKETRLNLKKCNGLM